MSTPTGPDPDDTVRGSRGPGDLRGRGDAGRGDDMNPPDNRFGDRQESTLADGQRDPDSGRGDGGDRIGGTPTDDDRTVRGGAPGVVHRYIGDPDDRQVEPVFVDSDRTLDDRNTVDNRSDRGFQPPNPVQDDTLRQDAVREQRVRPETVRQDIVHEEIVRPEPDRLLAADRQTVFAREKEAFGGMKLGSAFFGWLTATGLAVLLLSLLTAAGVAFGVTGTANVDKAVQASQNATGTAKTVGLIGGIVLLVILFLAYYCGGYVAGRMARFNGVKQGLAVWLWFIVTSAIIAAIAAIAGSKYNVLSQLNLPRIPVDEGSVTTAGIIAIVAAILAALLGALLGGAVGTRYHRRVDAVGFENG